MKLIIFLGLISIISLNAQDELILKLFPGKWKMEIENTKIYEEWVVVNDNELIGKSYSVEDDNEVISETLYLKKFGKQWAYVAVPYDQNITLFALAEYTSKKFTFKNKEHDFPQRIIYEFHKDGRLTASIEGTVNGENQRREFSFKIVED